MQIDQGPVFWPKQQGCAKVSCTGPLFWNMVTIEILSENWQAGVPLQTLADDIAFEINNPTGAKLKSTRLSWYSKDGRANMNSQYQ
ncbi:hypothetical protein AVEN_275275-1 [Araneus ventricosus]|uniref:Uncharacterized protein n=1 Tax=Araneus ventricosus TaxID=182803 RepID=A0A4Y2X137_ARAVE|nr:hypothetical protein AVEN_275275-1 [Araneus ventricosus]